MTQTAASRWALLAASEASRVVRRHPELADDKGGDQAVVALGVRDAAEAADMSDIIAAVREANTRQQTAVREILAALLPAQRLAMSAAMLDQIQQNAQAQAALADEFGLLTSSDVAVAFGSRASNVSALANRWRKEGRIFAVDAAGVARFPGFQFTRDGRPKPVLGLVLQAVNGRLGDWDLAMWFTASVDWLGGCRPVDLLDSDPEQVVEAAQRMVDELLA